MTDYTMTTAPISNTKYLNKKQNGHRCESIATGMGMLEVGGYGEAVCDCWEGEDGTFVADNGEYANRVNYCPFCGAKAPTQI